MQRVLLLVVMGIFLMMNSCQSTPSLIINPSRENAPKWNFGEEWERIAKDIQIRNEINRFIDLEIMSKEDIKRIVVKRP